MNKHRYSLEKGSKKHHCPDCGKKTFVLYIDAETSEYLPGQYGRCDRESKCSYHLNPYLDGYAKANCEQEQKVTVPKQKFFQTQPKQQPNTQPVFFDFETFKKTLKPERYEKNTFLQNLFYRVQFPFDVDEVTKVIQLYRLGTIANGYRAGATTFPFIDVKQNVRAIQVKQFDEQNHSKGTPIPLNKIIEGYHRKNNKPLTNWLEAYNKNESIFSCLFGEHLLSKFPNNPIALVEAPKTAIYCWLYFNKSKFPIYKDCIWLAVGAKGWLNEYKVKVLQGRIVYVLPDLSKDGSTFKEWENKVNEYEKRLPNTRFIMDDLLEKHGTLNQREQGADIADVLTFDWRTIRAESEPPQPEAEKVTHQQKISLSIIAPLPKVEVCKTERIQQPKGHKGFSNITTRAQGQFKKPTLNESWEKDITELENYFTGIPIPTQPVKLNQCCTITDFSLFIESHLATVIANNGKRAFLPYLNRLQILKQVLANKQK